MLVSASDAFAARSVETTVIGQGEDNPFTPNLEAAGYSVHSVPSLRTPRGVASYARVLQQCRPDVVHIHPEANYVAAALVARLLGIRAVRTVHNVFQQRSWRRAKRVLRSRVGDGLVSALVAPSSDVAHNERSYGRKPVIIPNWVDDNFFALERQPVAGTAALVGNCSPIKNHAFVLTLLFELGFSVYHHGDEGAMDAGEAALLAAFEADGRLLYRGTQEPSGSLRSAHVYLMPSTQEGMPVALMEAMVAGVPALVSRVPGMHWTEHEPNVTQLPLNDAEAWRAALSRAGSLGGAPSPSRGRFSAIRGVDAYLDLYKRATGKGTSGDRASRA